MKQNICVVIFLLLSTICKAQTFIYPQNDSILTEYNDGKFWAYLNKNDFVVGLSCFEEKDDYGKYYHLDIFIKNLSETPIVFQPDSVHSNLLTKKDDTLKLEVYTNEEYQKKIKRSQAWAMALYGISAGINAGTAGYSTSYSTSYSSNGYAYTTITNHYDANAAYQANVASTNQMLTLGQMMDNDRTIREQGYLKTTTIYPDEAIIGYMNIKREKGKILIVNIGRNKYSNSYTITLNFNHLNDLPMKKLTIIFYLFLIPLCVFAQNESSISHTKTVNDSTLIKIHAIVEDIDFRMHGLDRYKLYPTENIYNFLQLDTMTGKIEIVQCSLDDDKEGSATLNNEDLSLGTGCGTFELYPTKNIYQFLLLDKVTGRRWHVQWGFESSKRWIKRIY